MVRTICDGGINWNWYLCADFDDVNKVAHIYYYDRWHKYEDRGEAHPKSEYVNGFSILEDNERQVYGIRLREVEYLVTNPGYIFDYHDFSKYEAE